NLSVFANLELARKTARGITRTLFARLDGASRDAIAAMIRRVGLRPRPGAGRRAEPRPEAVARNRHAADSGRSIAAAGRAGRRHDRSRDRGDGRTGALARGRAHGGGGRARHGIRTQSRVARHGAARRGGTGRRLDRLRAESSGRHRRLSRALIMLAAANIQLYYGASHILRDVSVTAAPGTITCVLGRNGVGKTSLLRAIMGLQPVRDGRVIWEGADIAALRPHERARRGLAL